MAAGVESFFSIVDSLFRISSRAEVIGVLGVVLSWFIAFFRYSHAFFVCLGQPLAWRKASTVDSALWVWRGSLWVGSGEGEDIVVGVTKCFAGMQGIFLDISQTLQGTYVCKWYVW